jgi:hypothetical protein
MATTMRGTLVILVVALGLLATACGGDNGSSAADEPDPPVGKPLLPDLAPSPPQDIQMGRVQGEWHIKFSSILVNLGKGDFVLRATREPGSTWSAEQDVQYSTSGAKPIPVDSPLAWGGDGHEHWHIQRVASVWLVPLDASGKPASDSKERIDTKIGFCFYDFTRLLENGPEEAVYSRESCGHEDDTKIGMGLSIGWTDNYVYDLPGQSIDITGLPDGAYRLWTAADEQGWFRETTRKNNVSWADVELSTEANGDRTVEVTDPGPPIRPRS